MARHVSRVVRARTSPTVPQQGGAAVPQGKCAGPLDSGRITVPPQSARPHRPDQAQRSPQRHRNHRLTNEQPDDVTSPRPKAYANANLVNALTHAIGEHTINSRECEADCQRRESGEERCLKSRSRCPRGLRVRLSWLPRSAMLAFGARSSDLRVKGQPISCLTVGFDPAHDRRRHD